MSMLMGCRALLLTNTCYPAEPYNKHIGMASSCIVHIALIKLIAWQQPHLQLLLMSCQSEQENKRQAQAALSGMFLLQVTLPASAAAKAARLMSC